MALYIGLCTGACGWGGRPLTSSSRVASNDNEILREDLKTFWDAETVGYSKENVFYKFEKDFVYNENLISHLPTFSL